MKGKIEGDVRVEVEDAPEYAAKGLTALRFILMVSLYAGLIAVVCSVFTIQHPAGDQYTPPLSPTMQCVLNLSFQYFLIYALLWIFYTIDDFAPDLMGDMMYSVRDAIERKIHRAVRSDALHFVHRDPDASFANYAEPWSTSGLGARWYVLGELVRDDPVCDVPGDAGVHRKEVPAGQPRRRREERRPRQPYRRRRRHLRALHCSPCPHRRCRNGDYRGDRDDAGDRERARSDPADRGRHAASEHGAGPAGPERHPRGPGGHGGHGEDGWYWRQQRQRRRTIGCRRRRRRDALSRLAAAK